MEFGISIPTCREGKGVAPGTIGPEDLIRLAMKADELGFDSAWANDHLTPTSKVRGLHTRMPSYYEVITTLAYCAAVTKRLRVATGVVVAPFRDPVLLAKQIATLDALSGGRVIMGVGMGSDREEFRMLFPRMSRSHRGKMLDESLEAIGLLLNEPIASYKGAYHEFRDVVLQPKPVQRPFPIYVSGRSPHRTERAVKYGSGMMMFSPTVQEMGQEMDILSAIAIERKRDLVGFAIIVSTTLSIARTREEAIENFQESEGVWAYHTHNKEGSNAGMDMALRQNLIGTPEDIVHRLSELKALGLDHCAIRGVAAVSTSETIEQWEMFASEVMPKLRDVG